MFGGRAKGPPHAQAEGFRGSCCHSLEQRPVRCPPQPQSHPAQSAHSWPGYKQQHTPYPAASPYGNPPAASPYPGPCAAYPHPSLSYSGKVPPYGPAAYPQEGGGGEGED